MIIDISNWILNDEFLYGIKIGDSLDSTLTKLKGKNGFLVGTNEIGYYQYNDGFRIGFSKKKIDEICVLFDSKRTKVIFKNENIIFNLKRKKIHKILDFLNDNLIKWQAIESLDTNYLMIKILRLNIVLIFDVFEGELSKMVKSNLNLQPVDG